MRREQLFSRDGFYSFVVESNVLLHREAIAQGGDLLAERLAARPAEAPVRVLDLACGGMPVTTAAWMRRFSERTFLYTGVDINPDQIEAAGRFVFPDNVTVERLLEGSAWDLRGLALTPPYDVIYVGMNLHHGTPEEIHFLARQLPDLLAPDGVFINHDWYRPADAPYQRRPDAAPDSPAESFLLVDKAALAEVGIAPPEAAGQFDVPAWKARYRDELTALLIARGGDPEGAYSSARHIQERDYPVSVPEAVDAMRRAGLAVRGLDYGDRDVPLREYFAMLVAQRAG